MRFVAIAIILLSLPLFCAMLTQYRDKRDWALFAIGVMLFMIGDQLQIDAAIVTWRLWQGTIRGIFISPIDTLSLALIITRTAKVRVHFIWLVGLFLLPVTMSVIVSQMPMASLFAPMQILRAGLMFYALAGEFVRPSALRAFLGGVAVGLTIQAGFVVEQKLSGVVQAKGTADHQNILGMMVEAAVIPLVALILEGDRRKLLLVGVIAAFVIVAGGGSRGTMAFCVSGVALMLILSLLRNYTPRKAKFLGLTLLAAVVFVPLGAATLKDRFGSRSVTTEDEMRPAFARAARAMADDYPFGVGANAYVFVANGQGYSQRAGVSWGGNNLAAPVHNSYLLARAETGWLGEGGMLLFVIYPILIGLRIAFANRRVPMAGMALAVATAYSVSAIHSNFEYAWHLEVVQRLVFSNLAILSAAIAVVASSKAKQARARRRAAPARSEAMPT